jgi:DNA-binding LacI/PurR family transcriptional regulator
MTAWQAVHILEKQGVVTCKPGCRPKVSLRRESCEFGHAWAMRDGAVSGSAWERTRQAILGDILNGTYLSGKPLPSSTTLRQRYGVSYDTLRKSLRWLAGEEILVPHGRGYIPAAGARRFRGSAHIALVVQGNSAAQPWFGHVATQDFVRALEQNSLSSGAHLTVLVAFEQNGKLQFGNLLSGKRVVPRKTDDIFGYIYPISHTRRSSDIIQRLTALEKPVFLIDEIEYLRHSRATLQKRLVSAIAVTSQAQAGARIVRYLLEKGHRKLTWISPFHEAEWSRERLAGIRAFLENAGRHVSLHSVTVDDCASFGDYLPANRRHISGAAAECIHNYLSSGDPALSEFIQRNLRTFSRQADSEMRMRQRCAPFLIGIPEAMQSSAWIAANDRTAFMLLGLCKVHGITIGETLSLISFDDSREAYRYGLTSYNFNPLGVVTAVMNSIFNPQYRALSERGKVMHIDGMIMERRSVRTVKNRI